MKISNFSDAEQEVYDWLQDEESQAIFSEYHTFTSGLQSWDDVPIFSKKTINSLKKTRYVLYGIGRIGKRIANYLQEQDLWNNCIEIWDGCTQYTGQNYLGKPIMTPHSKQRCEANDILVIITPLNLAINNEMRKIAVSFGYNNIERPFLLETEFLLIFRNAWEMRCETQKQYFDPKIILQQMQEGEVFVDGGSYNFATSLDFLSVACNPKKIIAFEASPHNKDKVINGMVSCNFNNVDFFPKALWSESAELAFEHYSFSYGDEICDQPSGYAKETLTIPACSIDETILVEDKISFIKLDVEGAELQALLGAKKTIITHKPKLAISLYHRPQDYYRIPLFLKSLVPEYMAYIRHEQNDTRETVLYCVMRS